MKIGKIRIRLFCSVCMMLCCSKKVKRLMYSQHDDKERGEPEQFFKPNFNCFNANKS